MSAEDSPFRKAYTEEALTPEWRETIDEGIETAIEGFDILFYPSEENDPLTPVSFSPIQISGGVDERRFIDLAAAEREFIKSSVFNKLGINRQSPIIVGTYVVDLPHPSYADWEGTAHVQVVETDRSEDGVFLHEIGFPDERVDYFLATEEYRL